jgi:hypothetical protein
MPFPAPPRQALQGPKAPQLCSLFDALARINDPQDPSGRRHPLPALLGLLIVSFCTGGRTVKDAVLYARGRDGLRKELGFTYPTCLANTADVCTRRTC